MAVADVKLKYCFEDLLFRKILYSPIKKTGFVPEKNTEIFISTIPFWITVYDLAQFFERAGEIYQIKLLMEPDGIYNRGIAFVTYMNAKQAQKAMDELKHQPFIGSKCLNMQKSANNCRIFVGGLPTVKTKDEIWQELTAVYDITNIVDVITYRNYSNAAHNRGFVFLEFRTHEEASFFRAKYAHRLFLFGKQLLVDWSVPMLESDERLVTQVKIIHVKNLNVTLSSEEFAGKIYKLINRTFVEKVYKFKNYAFIHLDTRQNAEKLLNILTCLYEGSVVEVTWANPPNKFSERSFRDRTLVNRKSKAYNDECPDYQLSGHSSVTSKSPTSFRPRPSGLSCPISHSNSPHLLPRSSNTIPNPQIAAAPSRPAQISTPTRFLGFGKRQTDLFSPNMLNTSDGGTSSSCRPSSSWCCCPSTSFAFNNPSWNESYGNVVMPHLPQNVSPLSQSMPGYRRPVYDQTPRAILNRRDLRTSTSSRLCDSTTRSTEMFPNSGTAQLDFEAMVNNLLVDDS